MTRVLLSLQPHIEDRLLPLLGAAAHVVAARPASAAEAADAVGRVEADLVIASATTRHLDAALVHAAAAAGVDLVALAAHDDEAAYARELGVERVVDAEARLDRILTAPIAQPHGQEPVAATAPGRGTVTVVWGPGGAPGRTTVAIALAAELAATGERVALVDADTIGAAIAPALGLFDEAPGFAAACRLAGADSLSLPELDRVAQVQRGPRGSFAVLTGIGRSARWPELSADRVTRVLDLARDWADHVVVDVAFNLEQDEEIVSDLFAPRRNAATIAAVRAADRIVAVGAADPVGLARFVRGYGDLVELEVAAPIRVLITKVRQGAIGLNPSGQIRSTLLRFLGVDDAVLVPSDASACDQALLTGRPLPDAAPKSAATAAIRQFVETEYTAAAPKRRRTPRLRRAAAA